MSPLKLALFCVLVGAVAAQQHKASQKNGQEATKPNVHNDKIKPIFQTRTPAIKPVVKSKGEGKKSSSSHVSQVKSVVKAQPVSQSGEDTLSQESAKALGLDNWPNFPEMKDGKFRSVSFSSKDWSLPDVKSGPQEDAFGLGIEKWADEADQIEKNVAAQIAARRYHKIHPANVHVKVASKAKQPAAKGKVSNSQVVKPEIKLGLHSESQGRKSGIPVGKSGSQKGKPIIPVGKSGNQEEKTASQAGKSGHQEEKPIIQVGKPGSQGKKPAIPVGKPNGRGGKSGSKTYSSSAASASVASASQTGKSHNQEAIKKLDFSIPVKIEPKIPARAGKVSAAPKGKSGSQDLHLDLASLLSKSTGQVGKEFAVSAKKKPAQIAKPQQHASMTLQSTVHGKKSASRR